MRKEAFIPVDSIANANAFMKAFSLPEIAKEEVGNILGVIARKDGLFFREQDQCLVKAIANETKEPAQDFTDALREYGSEKLFLREAYDFCYYSEPEIRVWEEQEREEQEIVSQKVSLAFTASVGKKLLETVAWEGVKDSFDSMSAKSNFDYLSDSIKVAGSIIDHAISFAVIKKSKEERNPYLPLVKLMSIGAVGFHFSLDDNERMAIDFAIKKDEASKIMFLVFSSDFEVADIGFRDWGESLAGFAQLT